MDAFMIGALTALIVGCGYYFFKKTDDTLWLIIRMSIMGVLSLLLLVGMIMMLVEIDSEYKWFSFFMFIPIIGFLVLLTVDHNRYESLSRIEKRKKALLQQEIKEKERNETIILWLNQCGMKFFIKYYKRLISLPLRDIDVLEDYPTNEKIERLTAAKSIIDNGYTKLAIDYILENYSTVLSQSEIEIATKIKETL